jgi:hypothetical protein
MHSTAKLWICRLLTILLAVFLLILCYYVTYPVGVGVNDFFKVKDTLLINTSGLPLVNKDPDPQWCHTSLSQLLLRPGTTELHQLQIALNIPDIVVQSAMDSFQQTLAVVKYDVHVSVWGNCIAVQLTEVRTNSSLRFETGGGSGFHSLVEGNSSIAYCPYVDHGDNNYTVFCPLYDMCANVDIRLLYVNYLAYAAGLNQPAADTMIFSRKVCRNSYPHHVIPMANVHWMKLPPNANAKSTSDFAWHLHAGQPMKPLMSISELQASLRSISKSSLVQVVGDSHSRNLAYYMYRLMVSNPNKLDFPVVHSDKRMDNIVFYWSDYVPAFFQVLHRALKAGHGQSAPVSGSSVHRTKQVVIMDVGSWDLRVRRIKHFVTKSLPAFRAQMAALSREGVFDIDADGRRVRFIFFTIPPKPLWNKDRGDVKINPMSAAAINRLMIDAMPVSDYSYGGSDDVHGNSSITLVDYFALTRIFINHTAPRDLHYLVVDGNSWRGDVGEPVARYISQLVCEHIGGV